MIKGESIAALIGDRHAEAGFAFQRMDRMIRRGFLLHESGIVALQPAPFRAPRSLRLKSMGNAFEWESAEVYQKARPSLYLTVSAPT